MKSLFLWIGIFSFAVATSLGKVNKTTGHLSTGPLPQPQKFQKCRSHRACAPKECCAGLTWKLPGTCIRQPQHKEKCNPGIKPGALECPCRIGMTCSTKNGKSGYGLCVYITPGPDEVDELINNGSKRDLLGRDMYRK